MDGGGRATQEAKAESNAGAVAEVARPRVNLRQPVWLSGACKYQQLHARVWKFAIEN